MPVFQTAAKRLLVCVVVLMTVLGCIQPVRVEVLSEKEIVLKCILTNDTLQEVCLWYSSSMESGSFESFDEASEVVITWNDMQRITFTPAGQGRWVACFRPVPGESYKLHISIPGREPLVASTTFPEDFAVYSNYFAPERWFSDQSQLQEKDHRVHNVIPLWMGETRYAEVNQALKQIVSSGGTTMHHEMPGMLYRIESTTPISVYVMGIMSDTLGKMRPIKRLGTNHRYVDRSFPQAGIYAGADDYAGSLAAAMIEPESPLAISVSIPYIEDALLFLESSGNGDLYHYAIKKPYSGIPLFDQYLRIATPAHYDNGLRDVFSMCVQDEISVATSAETMELYELNKAEQYFKIVGDFEYADDFRDEGILVQGDRPSLFFCAVSPEYDQYIQSVIRMRSTKNTDLLGTLYMGLNNYSNVEGGWGIFGAMSVLRHDCGLKKNSVPDSFPLPAWLNVTNEAFFSKVKTYYYNSSYTTYPAYPSELPQL